MPKYTLKVRCYFRLIQINYFDYRSVFLSCNIANISYLLQVIHREESEDWQLEIRGVASEDAGGYDCQINTYPKISTKVNLIVLTDQGEATCCIFIKPAYG